jgi:hypothetical protein
MGDNSDSALKLLIDLGVVGMDDVNAAKDLIKETGQAGKGAAEDIGGSMPENLAAWKNYRKVVGDAGEGTEGLHEKIHGLTILMRGAGPVAGELGHLLHFAMNPAFLGAALGAGAEEIYFKWLEKREEKYKSLIDLGQKLNDSVREIIKSGKTEDEEFIEFNKTLAEAQANARGLAQDLSRDKEFGELAAEGMDAALTRAENLHKATADISKRMVDMFEAMGRLQPGEGDQLKLQIEHAAKLKEYDDERKRAAADLSAKQGQLDQAGKDIGRYGDERSILTGKEMADNVAQRNEVIIAKYLEVKKAFTDADNAAKNAMSKDGVTSDSYVKALDLRNSLFTQMQSYQGQYDAAKNSNWAAEYDKAAADKLWTDFQAAKETIKGLREDVDKARQKLQDITSANAGKIGAENQSFGMEAVTDIFKKGGSVSSIFSDAINAMAALNNMKDQTGFTPADVLQRGNPSQIAYIQHLQAQVAALQALEMAVGNQTSVIAAINTAAKNHGQNSADLQQATVAWQRALQIQLNELQSQVSAQRNGPQG